MCTNTNKPESRKVKSQGMNWISQHKRLAIYLRDGLACCYCGSSVTEGTKLTLDHLLPYSLGGSNKETNLVTCCHKCNSSRGNRDYVEFANSVGGYIQVDAAAIVNHIKTVVTRKLDVKFAKELVDRQGSCFKVLSTYEK